MFIHEPCGRPGNYNKEKDVYCCHYCRECYCGKQKSAENGKEDGE